MTGPRPPLRLTRRHVIIGVSSLVALVFITLGIVRLLPPKGQPSPELLVDAYLRALAAKDADAIVALSRYGSDGREAARHVRLWGGLNPRTVNVTITSSSIGQIKDAHLTSDSDPSFNVKLLLTAYAVDPLHRVERPNKWFLSLGPYRRPNPTTNDETPDDGTPLRERPASLATARPPSGP